jgi:site-specific DNA-methyltransferase (adenine-specific)
LNELRDVEAQLVPLDSLKAYDGNAKRHDSDNIDAIANSISEFGFRNPILAWHNEDGVPEIVAGHGRAAAAKKLRMEQVPVIFVDDLTDAQRRMLTLADNQTTLMTGWDDQTLQEELDALTDVFDVAGFGFDIDEIIGDDGVEVTEDEPDDDAEDRVKPGELWRMGGHVLLCGDSTDADGIARLMSAMPEVGGAAGADLLLTDPPYNVALGQHDRPSEAKQLHRRTDGLVIANDSWADDECFVEFLRSALTSAMAALRPGAAFYVWYASAQSANFLEAAKLAQMEVKQILVWAKNTFALGRQDYQWRHELCLYGWKGGSAHYFTDSRKESTVITDDRNPDSMSKSELVDFVYDLLAQKGATTVLEFDKPTRSELHPTMKPVSLFAYQIMNSTRRGETVLDVFGGSGTSVVACEQTGRHCACVELDPHYASVIVDRWEKLTGGKAEKIEE